MKNTANTNLKILGDWLKDSSFYSTSKLKDEQKLWEDGEKKALLLFQSAAQNTPAYKNFLHKNKINPIKIRNIQDFSKVPPTTKKNYIEEYSLKERSWDGDISTSHMISTSSGTSGEPHFWSRSLQTEIEGAYPHEFLLKEIFHIDKVKTLFINGFALGNWIAGTFTSACINLVAWKGYPLTNMTPGYSLEAVTEIVEKLRNEFEQIIITGHTPFLKEVVENLSQKKLLGDTSIKILGTGQAITERWRDYMLQQLNSKDPYRTVINLYGSADAALMGYETPLSIHFRKNIADNFHLTKKFFNKERLPSLYNFDPRLIYIEEVAGELHITKDSGCPLIRYNILDEGGVIPYSQMIKFFPKKVVNKTIPHWKLPFVYLFGRDKFMVKIYGANVYSEHVAHALSHEKLQTHITGRYILETEYDDKNNPVMICRVELNKDIPHGEELLQLIEETFVEEVRRINTEYNFVLTTLGKKVRPKIVLHEHGHKKYFPKGKVKKNA